MLYDRLMHAWHIKLDIISGQIFGKHEITCHSWYVLCSNWKYLNSFFALASQQNYYDLGIASLLEEKVSK